MKKPIKFSALFLPAVLLSAVLVGSGIFGALTTGFNLGIDFQAGFIEKVRIAPAALTLTYRGSQAVTVTLATNQIEVVATGVGSDNQSWVFPFSQYPDAGAFTSAVSSIPGIAVELIAPAETPIRSLFASGDVSNRLSAQPYRLFHVPEGMAPITTDDIRSILGEYSGASVQVLGDPADRFFQIRLRDDGSDPDANANLRIGLNRVLVEAFGADQVAVISTDFVGSRFSKTLADQAIWLVIGALGLIWIYATVRFRWDFALGAVFAVIHDALIIVAFIVWTKMEFNSITIAAILTIVGYSINDTVVIFDRIRENMKFNPDMNITDVLNLSQTEVLGRTIITTVTTLLAVMSLYIFTTGDMKNFALALAVGMISGVYSTIYIASATISFISRFRKDKGMIKEKVKPVSTGELV